jgi:hypothetical protein
MASLDELQIAASIRCGLNLNFRDHAIEILMKNRAGVDEIKLGNGLCRHLDPRQLVAQFFRQTIKNLCDLAGFAFMKTLQFVVGLDRLERLDESSGAR